MRPTVAILGLSVLGRETALALTSARDVDVIVFDYRREEVDAIAARVPRAIVADIRQTDVLEREGARHWSAAVVGIRRHFDITVLVTHFLKRKIGVPKVIVQVNSAEEEEAIRVIGADRTVFPERDNARQLAASLSHPLLTELFALGGDAEIIEIAVPREFVNRSLRQVELRARFQVHAVAIRRLPKDAEALTLVTEVPPNPDRVLKSGERMLVIGEHEALGKFLEQMDGG